MDRLFECIGFLFTAFVGILGLALFLFLILGASGLLHFYPSGAVGIGPEHLWICFPEWGACF